MPFYGPTTAPLWGRKKRQMNVDNLKGMLDVARTRASGGPNRDNTFVLNQIEKQLKKANASYESIGTSEEEMAKLLMDGYKAAALMNLGYARDQANFIRSPVNGTDAINAMEDFLQKAGLSYNDIGTSEQEVAELRKVAT